MSVREWDRKIWYQRSWWGLQHTWGKRWVSWSKRQEARSSSNEKFLFRGGEHITEDYIFLPASPLAVFSPNLTAQVTNQLNLHLHDGMAPLFPYMCNEERKQSRCFEYWSFVTESESRWSFLQSLDSGYWTLTKSFDAYQIFVSHKFFLLI